MKILDNYLNEISSVNEYEEIRIVCRDRDNNLLELLEYIKGNELYA